MRILEIRKILPTLGGLKLQAMLADPAYGLPIIVGRDRLFAILRKYNLQSRLYKRRKNTSISAPDLPVYPFLIKGLVPERANQVWVSDITYIRLAESKFCYLFLVSDLYSRKVLGYAVRSSLNAEGAEDALQKALKYAKPEPGFIHHSDHGVQYCCKNYVAILKDHGAEISMTGPDKCFDNAVAERINGILKTEFGLDVSFPNTNAVRLITKDSIRLYNDVRPHLSLKLKTPSYVYEKSINKTPKSAQENNVS